MQGKGNHSEQNNLEYLNQIILTQSRLAEADFNVEQFMNLVVEQMARLTPATGVVIELVEGDEMVYRAATGTVKTHIGLRLNRENSISGLCVKEKKTLLSDDTEVDPRVNVQACRLVQARSMVVTPLFYEGNAVGVIKVLSKTVTAFNGKDVFTLQLMAGFIGSALAHQIFHEKLEKLLQERTQALEKLKKAEETLKHMAHYDFLTGLPNRSLFSGILNVAVTRAKRTKKLLALFFLDIDHFKNINDSYGHDIGDQLLQAFAARIKHSIRKSDVAARLGGDEFIILLDEVSYQDNAIRIANKIIQKMEEPLTFQNISFTISTSIGIVFFSGEDISAEELIKCADKALYSAKKAGRNNFKIYNADA